MEVSAMHSEPSAVDEKQRSPLLKFYLSALAFAGALVLIEYLHSPWREILRVLMIAIAGFALWTLIRFLKVADQRQRRIDFRAFRFGFAARCGRSFFWRVLPGVGHSH